MNQFFQIDANKTYTKDEIDELFQKNNVSTEAILEQDVLVNAHFLIDSESDFGGKNVKREVSDNDVEKEFSWRCYDILGDQAGDETGIGNVARSWGSLKEAIRQWFADVLPEYNSIQHYKVFLNDVNKNDSVFRNAICQALKTYKKNVLDDFLKKKREAEEAQKSKPFVLKSSYAFTEDYKEYDKSSALSYVQPFRLPASYPGRDNETNFIDYLEQNGSSIDWWFKNGTGKDALGFKYTDSLGKDHIFNPDWLIKFKDGRIGIFDTKSGFTANESEVKDKAEALAKRIQLLNSYNSVVYVGGIVIPQGGVWLYNDSTTYESYEKSNQNWKQFGDLLK